MNKPFKDWLKSLRVQTINSYSKKDSLTLVQRIRAQLDMPNKSLTGAKLALALEFLEALETLPSGQKNKAFVRVTPLLNGKWRYSLIIDPEGLATVIKEIILTKKI